MMAKILVQVLPEFADLQLPHPATSESAGVDLRAAIADTEEILPGHSILISTGLRVAIPKGYEWQIRPRSGLALNHGITLLNSPGTIDSDYRGVVGIILINHGLKPFIIRRGDRIAQAVLAAVEPVVIEKVGELPKSLRGEGGFGHTGV